MPNQVNDKNEDDNGDAHDVREECTACPIRLGDLQIVMAVLTGFGVAPFSLCLYTQEKRMLEYVAMGDHATAVAFLLAATPERSARYYRDALCTLALAVSHHHHAL